MPSILDENESLRLVRSATQGDGAAWERLMSAHRAPLGRMVALRLDRRLQGRIDPSDVIQEAYVDAARRLADYAKDPPMPFFLWIRFLTGQRVMEQHRRRLGAQARDVAREAPLYNGDFPETTTENLADSFLGNLTSPSEAAIRDEQKLRLQEALDSLEPIDREILALRHFEQLPNKEAAQVLGLEESAAHKRYTRALVRLKDVLLAMPGGWQS